MNFSHPFPLDKNKSIRWAQNILANKDQYVILDTETTGLGNRDVVIQLAIIDLDGNTLFNSLFKPRKRKRIPEEATEIHGIKMSDLKKEPAFADLVEDIYYLTKDKTVIIYNDEFDERLIEQTCLQDEVRVLRMKTTCAMKMFSQFLGLWSEYHGSYRFQRLPDGDHTALGDCLTTLEVVKTMANADLIDASEIKTFQSKDQIPASETDNHGCIMLLILIGFSFIAFLIIGVLSK